MYEKAVRRKIDRLRAGVRPRVLDLFSGCGGLSLGFHAAGAEITAAVELDADAARSHGINFHSGAAQHTKARDITTTTPTDLTKELALGEAAQAFDVIIGGPPCQAFARVGRSKLREVADHPEAFRHDPRARLYIDYLDYVEHCVPLAVLMENVPDMMNHGGHNIAEEVCEVLESRGYVAAYTLLNAAYYGVPQMRERMFLIACRKELVSRIRFPAPTHWINLPPGYDGSRAVATKLLARNRNDPTPVRYQAPPDSFPDLPRAVTAKEALGDFPEIIAPDQLNAGTLRRGARRFDQPILNPRKSGLPEFARQMREWPGFQAKSELYDHVIRYLPRDYDLFARLEPGDQYPEAVRRAEALFSEKLARHKRAGRDLRKGSAAWEALRAETVPPYDAGKFPNKWRKMEADQPARTLLAHLGKDSYSHIHYDNVQARTISVREAARLQSFPDGFVFSGTMNPAFRQIGNAVPPLMAKAVAEALLGQMRNAIAVDDQPKRAKRAAT